MTAVTATVARSLTPPLDPLSFFLDPSKANISDDEDAAGDEQHEGQGATAVASTSSSKALIPEQRSSIINQRAIIRYYRDLGREPRLLGDEKEQEQKQQELMVKGDEPPAAERYDVSLLLDVSTGCGGKIWPAAQVLGQYLAGKMEVLAEKWKGKTVVELGSGTGLVGFLLAKMGVGAETWVTDQDAMLALMERNLQLNTPGMLDPCHVAELNWGEFPLPQNVPSKPDVLLLADCVYLEVAFQPLVDTMIALSTAQTEILFCYMKRRKADKRFFTLLKKHFSFEDVGDDDPVRTEAYRRQGLRFYRIKLKVKGGTA